MLRNVLISALAFTVIGHAAWAADKGTADEAIAMAKKTVAAIKADGTAKTYAAITAKDPRFVDRDLYAIVYDINGTCLAHGANVKMVGKDLAGNMDTDGKYYIKERMELAKTNTSFWQDYKFTNPTTKKIEPKSTYCEKIDDTVACVGIYK